MAANRLITIAMSHFNEKARWALDLAGIPYREEPNAPGLHIPSILRLRAETTPVMVLSGGRTLRGSDVILEYASAQGAPDLLPGDPGERAAVDRWLRITEDPLAVETRRWFYASANRQPELLSQMAYVNAPGWQRAVLPVAKPAIRRLVSSRFGLDDGTVDEAAARIRAVFAEADAARGDSIYLVGGRFTAADLAFAALAAPVVFPEGYGPPGALTFDELDGRARAGVEAWRNEPSSSAVRAVYARHRRPERPA